MSEMYDLAEHARANCWTVEQVRVDGVRLFSPGSGQRVTYRRLSDYYRAMDEPELEAEARKAEQQTAT